MKCTGGFNITEVKMAVNEQPEAYHASGTFCEHKIYHGEVLIYNGQENIGVVPEAILPRDIGRLFRDPAL